MSRLDRVFFVVIALLISAAESANGQEQPPDAYKKGLEALNKAEWDSAIKYFSEAIQANPKHVDSYIGRSRAYAGKNDFAKAIEDCDEAIRIDPQNAEAYYRRGVANQFKGVPGRAYTDYSTAIHFNPKHAAAFANRGYLNHVVKKEYENAKNDYEEAGRLDPKNSNAQNNLGWLLCTCPEAKMRDGKKAIEYATKACELTEWKNPLFVDTLAAAHAEVGNFPEAVKWQKKALEKPEPFGKEEAEKARQRLKLYEEGKPFRTE